MTMYFYNPVTKSCERFIYGGCKGNGNRFSTKEECLRACGQPAGDVCRLPPEVGPCKARIPSYFYNPVTKSCERFIYGGCKGNGNRFATEVECLRTCGQPGKRLREIQRVRSPSTLVTETFLPRSLTSMITTDRLHPSSARAPTKEECLRTCGQPAGDVCQLPPDAGPCEAHMTMYFYNPVTKSCETFIYGGCLGNGNRFETEEECLRACGQPAGDVCQLPPDAGPCEAHMTMYFYNPVTKSCETFIYGGCLGNGNRFETEEECLRACGQPAGDVCQLPPDTGPCEAYMPMYFYNPVTKSCEMFIYGGCLGNENRFSTKEECLRACGQPAICKLPVEPGPCFTYVPNYFYNSVTKRCEEFIYGGCQGNENRFPNMDECLKICGSSDIDVCQLPRDPGPCQAFVSHYFYNSATKACEEFRYGGCQGNENRFATKEKCFQTCGRPVNEICKLPVDAGSCFSYMTRYFYNSVTDSCEEFIYGGCEGNQNRFSTKNECLKTCGRSDIDICKLPMKPGPCQAFVRRYFYNSVTKKCEKFRYGGCQGNENRFANKEECLETCVRPVNEVCKLPMDSGSCFSYQTRYFYNWFTRKCEAFTYGGCEGNGNRFASIDECLRTCGSAEKPGSCPTTTGGLCILGCNDDDDCAGRDKCCSNGCGRTCQPPVQG
nr:papilin-like isoform X2 [Pelodiscus sinensis]|eukprot:XP_025044610.1 papilin-like isoform X2 [Pelodiscus sinensis]